MPYPNHEYFEYLQLLEKLRAGNYPHCLDVPTTEHRLLTAMQLALGAN